MATDAAIERGLELSRFSPATTAKLKKALPAAANVKNPIDVIGDARDDRYGRRWKRSSRTTASTRSW